MKNKELIARLKFMCEKCYTNSTWINYKFKSTTRGVHFSLASRKWELTDSNKAYTANEIWKLIPKYTVQQTQQPLIHTTTGK